MTDPIDQEWLDFFGEAPEPTETAELDNTTRFGYPFPPDDFGSLPIDEIRRWGRMAIDAFVAVDVEVALSDGQVDTSWAMDAQRWSAWVLDLVWQAIGGDDRALLAYAHNSRLQADQVIRHKTDTMPIRWQKEGF